MPPSLPDAGKIAGDATRLPSTICSSLPLTARRHESLNVETLTSRSGSPLNGIGKSAKLFATASQNEDSSARSETSMLFSPALPAPSAHMIATCIAVPLLAFALLLSCFGIGRSPATFSRGTFFGSCLGSPLCGARKARRRRVYSRRAFYQQKVSMLTQTSRARPRALMISETSNALFVSMSSVDSPTRISCIG